MVEVKVEQGILSGEYLETVTGEGKYFSFKGIPYAEPPLGKLRFKAPRPPLSWEGVRKATNHGPVCTQKDIFTQEIIDGSEDCLYLNVYSPNLKPESPLPVMVFIHGGGFQSGSGNEDNYGPDFLVNHGIILVTLNYRLGALGFLCLDIEEVPGNAGLKDQVAALRWVKSNIASFGGDPNNVTVFGQSAGGASTCLHMLSPMSIGLFKRAIPMSGSPLSDWASAFKPQKKALKLTEQLGLKTNDPAQALDFLQTIPVNKFIGATPYLMSFEEANDTIGKCYHFAPVVEKIFDVEGFITEDVVGALKQKKYSDVDVLIGYTSEESLIFTPEVENILQVYSNYADVVVPKKILLYSNANIIFEVANKIYDFYFEGNPPSMDKLKEFLKFLSDTCIEYDIHRFISRLPKVAAGRRYMYKFSCISERTVYGKICNEKYGIEGTAHCDDLMYLFDAKKSGLILKKNTKEYELINLACTVFANFAKYGTPTPDASLGIIWPEYENKNKYCVDIQDNLLLRTDPNSETLKFWKNIFEYSGLEF